jgi:hypothetical protein
LVVKALDREREREREKGKFGWVVRETAVLEGGG